MDKEYSMEHLVEKCDYETKLAVAQWVMKHIVDHAKEGGSYRYLIYQRLGFDMDAYAVLLDDGMTISNEFDLNQRENIEELFKIVLQDTEGDLDLVKFKFEEMKKKFAICDEKGCIGHVTAGIPQPDGYRSVCSEHARNLIKWRNK